MIKKTVALFIGFILFCFCANAQMYSYKHYTIMDGLPQNQIMRIYQDGKGFIWIGTKIGISRFDGKQFKNYQNNEMADVQLFFEYNQRLFCCAVDGIYLFDNNCFKKIYKSDFSVYGANFNVDRTEFLIYGNQNIVVFSKKGIKHTKWPDNEQICTVLPFHNKNGYWYSNDKGVYEVTDRKAKREISGLSHCFLAYNRQNILLVQGYNFKTNKSGNGVYVYNKSIKRIYDPGANALKNQISPTADKKYLISQNKTTWLLIDTIGNVIDKDSIPDIFINDIIQDWNGNLWIATETGLYYRQSAAFRNYDEKSGMPKYVWSIFEDNRDRSIVFATFPGELAVLKNNVLTKVENYKKYLKPEDLFYMNGFCNSLGEWMIPASSGTFTKRGDRLEKINLPFANFPSVTVFSCYEDEKSKKVYFGTTSGLFSYDLMSRKIRKCATDIRLVFSLDKDKYGRLWVCTGKGVSLFKDNAFTPFRKNEIPVNKGVISCSRDFKGNMWLAAKDALYLYTYDQMFKINNGRYFFVSQYKNKYVIAGTVKGILLIDLEKLYSHQLNFARFFDRYNGFIGIECGQNGTCVDSKGNVWIPTSESVVKFMPDKLTLDTVPPKTFVYSFETAKSDLVWTETRSESTLNLKKTTLDWRCNNVKIIYHAISFPCPERVHYKYRLIGYNDAWVSSFDESVIYTNLKPGNYRFEIVACNENGYWKKIPTVFTFEIVPAFWQTWWFLIIVSILVLLFVAYAVYYVMKRKQKEESHQREVEQKLVSMQVSAINAQLDPHFVFNAITAIGSEVQENNREKAYSYFVKVSHLLRASLKNTDKITRSLKEEMTFVENYLSLQKYRFEDRFNYHIDVAPDVDTNIMVPKMCIQIFVENAVKHGLEHRLNGGLLTVTVWVDNQGLHATIEDNGVGRAKSGLYNTGSTGIGLKVFADFFAIMNKFNTSQAGFTIEDLILDDGESGGTRVNLFIPEGYVLKVESP